MPFTPGPKQIPIEGEHQGSGAGYQEERPGRPEHEWGAKVQEAVVRGEATPVTLHHVLGTARRGAPPPQRRPPVAACRSRALARGEDL